jgi:proteasome alpha subunit
MAMPYYVSPEQVMQDKAEYARKGIAKGRSIIAMDYIDGVLLTADNPSASLHKVSEIYDCIAFAGAGKYSEFENLRKAGIRHADLKGFMYSREDVTGRSLANGYSQSLGTIFSQELKPLEVEILVVQVGINGQPNEMYRISFDGSIIDEKHYAVIGGRSEAVQAVLKEKIPSQVPSLQTAVGLCVSALEQTAGQKLSPEGLEVAVLDRNRSGRKFRRLALTEVRQFLSLPPSA